jgi:hypothetical protein
MIPKIKKTPKQQLISYTAKARKESIRQEKEQKYRREIENQQWIEHDKLVLRKIQRQQLKQAKRNEQMTRKAQNKRILEAETQQLNEIIRNQIEMAVHEEQENVKNVEMQRTDADSEEYLKEKLLNNKIVRDRPELFVNLNRFQPTEQLVDEK